MDQVVCEVHRNRKGSRALRVCMIGFGILFLVGGVIFSRALLFPCFLMAGLYYAYDYFSQRDYEYVLEGDTLTIAVIYGRRNRSVAHTLTVSEMIVTAPHDHPAVDAYRKGGRERVPKFDYTSYDEKIPYYTMIITEGGRTIKLLLDLNDAMLEALRRRCPSKVIRSK